MKSFVSGAYDEIYAIQKNSTVEGYELPSHRHAGYITILFKLLEEQTRVFGFYSFEFMPGNYFKIIFN